MNNITLLEQHIMCAIFRQYPTAYGISVQDQVAETLGKMPSLGSLYASLDRLERKGFVKSRKGEATPTRGGKAKLYYVLTASGKMVLADSFRGGDKARADLDLEGAIA